jgi:hypothetical protein
MAHHGAPPVLGFAGQPPVSAALGHGPDPIDDYRALADALLK